MKLLQATLIYLLIIKALQGKHANNTNTQFVIKLLK